MPRSLEFVDDAKLVEHYFHYFEQLEAVEVHRRFLVCELESWQVDKLEEVHMFLEVLLHQEDNRRFSFSIRHDVRFLVVNNESRLCPRFVEIFAVI